MLDRKVRQHDDVYCTVRRMRSHFLLELLQNLKDMFRRKHFLVSFGGLKKKMALRGNPKFHMVVLIFLLPLWYFE